MQPPRRLRMRSARTIHHFNLQKLLDILSCMDYVVSSYGGVMKSLIISGLVVITLLCTGLFIILCQVCGDQIDRRDAIDAEKNRREMGL